MLTGPIVVLGSGNWGTAQAHHLRRAGLEVTLWGRDPRVLSEVQAGRHPRFFGDFRLASGIRTEPDLESAVQDKAAVVVALPSTAVRPVARAARSAVPEDALVVSTSKGLEQETLLRMSEVLAEEWGRLERITVLSGPSFALEVLRGLPTAVTAAGPTLSAARRACDLYHHGAMRVYTSTDLVGVELGGVLKNVIALAAGVTDGFGMGNNARAALLTRGLAEIRRLVVALGGQAATVTGLSGLGDLLLTATGDLSRNRQVGLRLGRGESLEQILADLDQVAEGVLTARSGLELARNQQVEVPLIEETQRFLQGEHSVAEAVRRLLARAPKAEM
jgi:glycerol-3-phosphate dehydrogenase (NAD(P)+)